MSSKPSSEHVAKHLRDLFNEHIRALKNHPEADISTYIEIVGTDAGWVCEVCKAFTHQLSCCRHLREATSNDASEYEIVYTSICSVCEHDLSVYQHTLPLDGMRKQRVISIGHLYTQQRTCNSCIICHLRSNNMTGFQRPFLNGTICVRCKYISYKYHCARTYMMYGGVSMLMISLCIAITIGCRCNI